MLNLDQIRSQFPILGQEINGKPLIYFDNAATSQKPQTVINALHRYYTSYNSNVHRGVHTLADRATTAFEATRAKVKDFINATSLEEVIFTKGTTEGINLVANTYGKTFVNEGDEILISALEHHSNIVPWQMLCQQKNAHLKVAPINQEGELLLDQYEKLLTERTKIVAITYVSNALGTINPVAEIIKLAHQKGAVVLLDAAQASSHLPLDVTALNADFVVFSAHKLYGPTGIGILYGKKHLLEAMPPYLGGGEMIKEVTFEKTTYNELPFKFEAGTPNIADTIALKYALDFVDSLGREQIAHHEHQLLQQATQAMQAIPKVKIVGTAKNKIGVISFVVEGVHHFDLGMLLDANGIAIRTGNHCTMPLMNRLGLDGTASASFAVYNTPQEVETFTQELARIVKLMS